MSCKFIERIWLKQITLCFILAQQLVSESIIRLNWYINDGYAMGSTQYLYFVIRIYVDLLSLFIALQTHTQKIKEANKF